MHARGQDVHVHALGRCQLVDPLVFGGIDRRGGRAQRRPDDAQGAPGELVDAEVALQRAQQLAMDAAQARLVLHRVARQQQASRQPTDRPDDDHAEDAVGVADARDRPFVGHARDADQRRNEGGAVQRRVGVGPQQGDHQRNQVQQPHRDAQRGVPVGHEDRNRGEQQHRVEQRRSSKVHGRGTERHDWPIILSSHVAGPAATLIRNAPRCLKRTAPMAECARSAWSSRSSRRGV